MSYTLIFHPQSGQEYNQSYQWYETKQKGLGTRFEKEVTELLQKIEAAPDTYRYGRKPFREAAVKNFPFVIIYRVNKRHHIIHIISVFHTKRSPGKKYRK